MSVTLQVHNPTGMLEVVQSHAARLADLNGRIIGELSNGVWDDYRTFPFLRERLQRRFPGLKIIPYTEFPVGSVEIDKDSVTEMLLQKGCEAVITGNAA